jgi:hypothetical protein
MLMPGEIHLYNHFIYWQIKEVAPKASSSNATQTFWTKDVKVIIFFIHKYLDVV